MAYGIRAIWTLTKGKIPTGVGILRNIVFKVGKTAKKTTLNTIAIAIEINIFLSL
jgi:hypothetical protein